MITQGMDYIMEGYLYILKYKPHSLSYDYFHNTETPDIWLTAAVT